MASESNVIMIFNNACPLRCEVSPACLVEWCAIYSFHFDACVSSKKFLKCFIHYVYFITTEIKLFASKRLRIFLDNFIVLPATNQGSSTLYKGMRPLTHKTSSSRRYRTGSFVLLSPIPHDLGMEAMPVPSRCSNARTTLPEAARREQNWL